MICLQKKIIICTYRGRLLDVAVSGPTVLMNNPPSIHLPIPWTLLCREKESTQ